MPRVKNLASFGRRSTYSGALGVKSRNLEVDRDSKQVVTDYNPAMFFYFSKFLRFVLSENLFANLIPLRGRDYV